MNHDGPTITIRNWARHQHYKRPKPVWIKVYRDILSDYEFSKLSPVERWTVVGLWLLAAETDNAIPDDVAWIQQRLQLIEPPNLEKLQTLGIVSLVRPSRKPLEEVYLQTETETEEETDSVAKATELSLDVENWNWGDFAGWMRTEGCRLLWMDDKPPAWANERKPWTLERELSVWSALAKKGEPLAALRGVIERTREPTCGLHFYEAGRWDRYYLAKEEWRKAESQKQNKVGQILASITQRAS
jgi:hypothetical protein